MSSSIYSAKGRVSRAGIVSVALATVMAFLPCRVASAEPAPTSRPTSAPTSNPTSRPTSIPTKPSPARRPTARTGKDRSTKGIYPALNLSMTFGTTWGDSEYVTPLDGQFAFSLRAELALSLRRGSWGLGLYGEVADPGSHFESRWLGGGGLHLLSPRLWIFGAALSSGFYRRESETGAYNGFTSGLALGLRPRFCFWDFLVAVRVDLRQAFGRDEQSVTVSAQLDVAALFFLGAVALKGAVIFR